MLNSGSRGKRAKDGTGILGVAEHFNQQNYLIPTVTGFQVTDISYNPLDDTAANTAGSQTIVISGSGFAPGATVMVGTTVIGSVTWLDANRLTFTSPALSAGVYTIYVTNANGGTGILVQGLTYSGTPTFSVPAGSVGSYYETTAISTSVAATGDSPINYSIVSGSLPSGSTLNSTTGAITGTAPVDGSSTTYTFQVKAGDADFQESYATFTLTINTDVVTFSSPANNTTTTVTQNSPISNVTVVGTSAAGYGVLYTTSGLPTGLSMNTSTGIISGTPTVAPATNVSIITATANTTSRSATLYLNWTVNLPGDLFWKYASLLMSASTVPNGNTFNTDASTINNEVIVVADTKPSEFHPFKEGYYSNFFDGTGDYLSAPSNTAFQFGTSDFTIECWAYFNSFSGGPSLIDMRNGTANAIAPQIYMVGAGVVTYYVSGAARISGATLNTNTWYHLAIVRLSGVTTLYVNGIVSGTTYTDTNNYILNAPVFGKYSDTAAGYLNGYMSNIRLVKGTALYTATFTPPTRPLTYVANTSLITCQSNKLIDNSNNNFTITKNGDVTVNPFSPFDGTLTTVTVPAANNYSMYFDGTGDYLSGPSNYALITTGPFTIEMWVWVPSNASARQLFGIAHWDVGQNGGFRVYLLSNGTVSLSASTGTYNTMPSVLVSTTTVTPSTWTHIAFVRNSSNSVSCFINGVSAATPVTYASSLSLSSDGNIGQFTVGTGIYDGTATDLFTGYISNIRVINTALYSGNFTPSNSPLGLTQSSSANTAAISTLLPTNGASVYFDGSSDYLTIPSSSWTTLAGQFTVEFWVNFAAAPTANPLVGVNSTGGFSVYNDGTRITPNLFGTGNIFNSTFLVSGIVINNWYHIAVTRDNSNLMTMWVNGVSVGSATVATTYTQGIWRIGNSNFRCHISNHRVSNTCVYTTTFTPSTSPLTAISGTNLLTCQSYSSSNNRVIIDNGNNAVTISSVGDAIGKTLSPFANTPSILMAQANTIIDNSNNGITFTVNGDARPSRNGPFANTTTVTLVGNEGSAYFDGTGDYLYNPIANTANVYAFGTADYTIEAWIYPTATTAGMRVFEFSGNQDNIGINQTSTGTIDYYNGTTSTTSAAGLVVVNTWTHIALVRQSGTAKVYVNGALAVTQATTPNTTTARTLWIGGFTTTPFQGYISNVRVVKGTALYTTPFVPTWAPLTPVANTVLLTAQTSMSSNTKVVIDESNLNNLITANGNITVSSVSPFGSTWSLYANGRPQVTTTQTFTGDFTVEGWFYIQSWNGVQGFIIDGRTNSNSNQNLMWYPDKIQNENIGTVLTFSRNIQTETTGTWNHLAMTRSGSNVYMFINGTSLGSNTYGTGTLTFGYLNFLNRWDGAYNTVGYISNFRILNGTALYTSTFTPSINPLVSVANTRLLCFNSASGQDQSTSNATVVINSTSSVSKFSPFSSVTVTPASYSGYFNAVGTTTTYPSINVATSSTFNLYPVDSTVECWFILNAYGNGSNPTAVSTLFCFYGGSAALYYSINVSSAGFLMIVKDGAGAASITSTTSIRLNTWYHFAWVHTAGGTTNKFYLNGVDVTSTFSDPSLAGAFPLNLATPTFYIGGTYYNNTPYTYINPWNGSISNFRIVRGTKVYTGAFTPPTAQLGLSQSSGTNITALGIPANGNSVYFDGTGDYLSVPSNDAFAFGTSDFTIEFWTYPTVNARQDWIDFNNNGPRLLIYYDGTNIVYYSTSARITGLAMTLNTWQHIALVRSSGSTKLYINGNQSGSTYSDSLNFLAQPLSIGKDSAGSTHVTGYISNLRVVKGTALYTANTTPSTTPLTAVANTVLLTCQNSTPSNTRIIIDSSTNAFPISSVGDTVISEIVSPFGNTAALLTCQSTSFADTSNNAFAITVNGDARPVRQNPFTDTVSAASNYSANTFGNSIYFDGTTDYLTVAGATGMAAFGTSNFTVECWVYMTTFAGTPMLCSVGTSWSLRVNTTGFLQWYIGGLNLSQATIPLILNAWNHIAVVRTGTGTNQFVMYINGVPAFTGTKSDNMTATGTLFIGALDNGAGTYWPGYISNFRIIKGQALYTGPFIPSGQPLPTTANTTLLLASTVGPSTADATRNHNIETFGTARRVANNSPYYDTYSAYFDGTGDYLTLPSGNASLQPASSDFTIEAWVYPTAFVANGNPVAAIDVNGSYYAAIRFGYESSGAISLLMSTNGTTWSIQLGSGLGTLTLNTWQHMAVSKSGTSVRVFLNGVQQGSTQTLSSATLMTGTNNWIGYLNAPSAQYVNGYISNWRLTKTALYTTTFTPPTTPLTAIANTSLLTCQSNRFIDNSTNAFAITKAGDVKISAFQPFVSNNTSRFTSVYFPVKTDYLAVRPQPSLITFPGDFTFECWVYPTDTTLSSAWAIWDARQSGATAAATTFALGPLASPVTGSWRMAYFNGTNYYGTGTVLWNQWSHLAWVRSGTTMTFYVNGVAGGTATISGTQTATATTNPIYIGTKDNGLAGYGTVGYIADLRITNGYARTITVPTAPYEIK